MMEKDVRYASGKRIYLLGKDKDGTKYWLKAPSWDCDWYWGFGYVETYTNNSNPEKARGIRSHQHFDGLFFNRELKYDLAWKEFFKDSVLDKDEVWALMELMKTYYLLRDSSDLFSTGGSHISFNKCKDSIKNEDIANHINKELLPKLFEEITKLLTEESDEFES